MNFEWILLALFLIAIISGVSKALNKSMLKNTLRLASTVVAFLITFILQLCGAFQGIVASIVGALGIISDIPMLADAAETVYAVISTLVSPIFFIVVFFLIRTVLRIIVHFVLKGIENKEEKTAQVKDDEAEVSEEPASDEAENSDENSEAQDSSEASEDSETEENSDENDESKSESAAQTSDNEPKLTVEETVKSEEDTADADSSEDEPKKQKKSAFYPECAWKRVISLTAGAVGRLLTLAILLMPLFYLMSIATTATHALDESDATDSKVYNIVETVDKHITAPFESSFVYKFYDTVGVTDLANYTAKAGGKLTLESGETVYADDLIKTLASNGVSVAAQITSAKSECVTVKADIDAIVNDPIISSILPDVIIALVDDVEAEEPAEDDVMGGLVYDFITYYKDADKATVRADLGAVSETVSVLAKEGVLVELFAGNADLAVMLEEEETLTDVVKAISELSAFGPVLEGAFEMGIDILGETLNIPENDEEVYENFIDDLLVKMKRKKSNYTFDQQTVSLIKYYIYTCGESNTKVSSGNGINGHEQFMAYVSHWKQIQSAFAQASEDKSFGYFSMQINGVMYVYDDEQADNKRIVKYSAENADKYSDKISPVSGLINALTARSTTKQPTRDNLYQILTAYVGADSTAADVVSRDLAQRMLSKDGFTTEAVTLEKLQASTNFTDWTDEEKKSDSESCVKIIVNLLSLMDSIGSADELEGEDGALDMLDQFELLGKTMDEMKKTTCINGLPALLLEGIVKNEIFADYMSPSTAFKINEIVENDENATYYYCMVQIKDVLNVAINAFGGEINK